MPPNGPKPLATTRRSPAASELSPDELIAIRDLFWHNVIREMLTGLTAVAAKRPELMDGRFAVLTKGGERIPLTSVEPVFAYSVQGTKAERETSMAVQLTVFRFRTPEGEVFTLPVQEIRGFHELTPELLARIQQEEDEQGRAAGDPEPHPFGFAAFAALPKPGLVPEAPMHPVE